jgi:hypothetical protein
VVERQQEGRHRADAIGARGARPTRTAHRCALPARRRGARAGRLLAWRRSRSSAPAASNSPATS